MRVAAIASTLRAPAVADRERALGILVRSIQCSSIGDLGECLSVQEVDLRRAYPGIVLYYHQSACDSIIRQSLID